MGPGTKKKEKAVPNWMDQDEIIEDDVVPAWMQDDELIEDEPTAPVFDEDAINVNYEAPASVRLELSGLASPADKLTALRKHYPDAQPHGDGNFVMTNPENGETMLYNQEGWVPSIGDFAEAAPTAAEIAGAIGGGIFGGAKGAAIGGGTGAVAGSIVPAAGTAVGGITGAGVGGVTGAMAGAGVGGAGARDLAERGINWYFGNDDTRTLGEYAKDKAVDVGFNAAGEGAGMLAAKGIKAAAKPFHKWVAGKADDLPGAKQLAEDFAGANIPSTTGTITQNADTLLREAEIAKANPNSRIGQLQDTTDKQIGKEFDRISNGLAANTDSALRPTTGQNVGERLIGKADEANAAINAQRDALYQNVDNLAGGQASAGNQSTSDLLIRLNSEKKALGASAKMNKGSLLDEAVKQTKAASGDIKNMTFGQMQEMRSTIGKMAFDRNTDPYLASRYKDLYEAITKDMSATAKSAGDDAFKAWKQADAFNAGLYGPESTKEALKGLTKAADGETAYKFITGKVREGGTRLAKARKEIEAVGGAAEWDQMTATYLNRIGVTRAADGAEEFSGRKFVTEWNKMAPEAKDAMFGGSGRAQYRSDLDRLARIVDARQKAIGTKTRPVDPGSRLIAAAFNLGSFGTAAAGSAAKRSYTDRLLTNPEVVRWMTGIPQAQMAKGGLGKHISVLRNIVRESARVGTGGGQELESAVEQYLRDAGIEDEEKR